ncbi:MAG: hypothetical protein ACREQV_21790 [Candidatus Binatia bacterium]
MLATIFSQNIELNSTHAKAIFLRNLAFGDPVNDLLAVVGSMQMRYRVLARAIIQEECPDHLLGCAMSLLFLDLAWARWAPSASADRGDYSSPYPRCRQRRGLRHCRVDCATPGSNKETSI